MGRRHPVLPTRRPPTRSETAHRDPCHRRRRGRQPRRQEGGEHHLRLGAWVSNQRSRAASLSPDRVEQLSAIGMRWT
ncbi:MULTISPECIES: helicase associated domain-containing protein [unclassified Streptomyces]|uniref:helicase associated domain-containing protein n=1 Tax=unclassified Streptomyces TaxID=2593676 RepID=UPI001F515B0B|nr:helicase associated domain-containing protein [Streptomyces sp. CB01883]